MAKKKLDKQHALKHGAYSRETMLPGERISDYEALLLAHYEEWVPEGVTEQCLVDELAALRWRKRRMEQFHQISLWQHDAKVREENESNREFMLLRNLGVRFSEAANAEEADEILARLSPYFSGTIEAWVPRDKCPDPAQWHQEVGKYLSNIGTPEPLEGPNLFVAIVDPDLIEVEISRSERMDDAIDRKIRQLMQVKAAKQVFPSMRKTEPKLINPPAKSDDSPPLIAGNAPKIPEIVASTKSDQDMPVAASRDGIVVEAECIKPVSNVVSEDAAKKEHSNPIPAKVDFFTKQGHPTTEEMNSFSALCDEVAKELALSPSPGQT